MDKLEKKLLTDIKKYLNARFTKLEKNIFLAYLAEKSGMTKLTLTNILKRGKIYKMEHYRSLRRNMDNIYREYYESLKFQNESQELIY